MCDYDDERIETGLSRREFAAAGMMSALIACAPKEALVGADQLVQQPVSFAAPGGMLDGVFIHPASGRYPAVILWPDIAGLREAPIMMGRRLAQSGYAVLVANPYYRSVAGQQFESLAAWREQRENSPVGPWIARNTPDAIMETARGVVSWLDTQGSVDSARGIGVQGYCMTGAWTVYMAHAVPSRIKAAAAFHPGSLAADDQPRPIDLLADLPADAGVMLALAQDDHAKREAETAQLRAAGEAAQAGVSVEVYRANHGWTVPDGPSFDKAEGDRAWANLLALYSARL